MKGLYRVEPFGSGLLSGRAGTIEKCVGREAILTDLGGARFRMFKNRLQRVRYIYIGPNGEIGIPSLPVGYPSRRIEWWRNGEKIGTTKHLPEGTHGKML